MKEQIGAVANLLFNKEIKDLTEVEVFKVLVHIVREMAKDVENTQGEKTLYYLSSEFLMGRLLTNNLINLHIYDEVKTILDENGFDLARIDDLESEPSLGNGGLGRLAACFVDSISTLNYPGEGVGLLYHYGLFKQKFVDNKQNAVPDQWISEDSLIEKTDIGFTVKYADFELESQLYNVDVLGYNGKKNQLRLFDVKSIDETIVKNGITFDQEEIAKNLTLFLYPDDSTKEGELLRIYQQYFIVSNAVQLMLYKNKDLKNLVNEIEIQINDTHPTLVIPELIYQLTNRGFTFEQALEVVQNSVSYTNHTILAEALEKWPYAFLKQVVPHLMDIIDQLDKLVRNNVKDKTTYIIDEDKRVHMANMCIHYGKSVNGVAYLHTEILKSSELNNFYKLYPEKFNNKTNGITFRRWLKGCNNDLYTLINSLIDGDIAVDYDKLIKLLDQKENDDVLNKIDNIKFANKVKFAEYMKAKENIDVDPNSIFDVQIKRMHEYKRQQMNALYIIQKYLDIKNGILPEKKITFIFGGKAAPAYIIAQDVIHLLLALSELISNDEEVKKHIAIVFIENYNVSVAEHLIPAADISEQISLASKEASGTGNMKLMLNGAVTIGTMDGANVEIAELVGEDNIYIFGQDSDHVIEKYKKETYIAKEFYAIPEIKQIIDFITSKELVQYGDIKELTRLQKELINKDWFMTLLDLQDYIEVKNKCLVDYNDRHKWNSMTLVNIAMAGKFSSDRTIKEYNNDIWKIRD